MHNPEMHKAGAGTGLPRCISNRLKVHKALYMDILVASPRHMRSHHPKNAWRLGNPRYALLQFLLYSYGGHRSGVQTSGFWPNT